jgi:hypothetical protein
MWFPDTSYFRHEERPSFKHCVVLVVPRGQKKILRRLLCESGLGHLSDKVTSQATLAQALEGIVRNEQNRRGAVQA